MMYIFKAIICICSIILTYKAIVESNLEKSYNYLFSAVAMFALVILIKPIV